MIAYMNEEDRQSVQNQNQMEHRSLMEELVEMKMEYDHAKKWFKIKNSVNLKKKCLLRICLCCES